MYHLKIFDKTLIEFNIEKDLTLEIKDIKIVSKEKNLYPTILQKEVNEKNIKAFLETRVIPKNRGFVNEILNSVGANINDTKGIIDICKGLSLNDCYWIVEDDNLKFSDYNLYDNEFSETLSLIAFTGYTSKIKGIITSPELTTNGMLPKAWRRIKSEIYLYKGSTEAWKISNTGYEPYSEYYASQVAEAMGVNAIKYELARWKGELVSISKLFTSKEYSFVPIYFLIPDIDIKKTGEFMKENGFENEFADMILFDAIIANYDRHFGNFGLLRNNYTGEYTSFAPIFDNGEGLLSKADPKIFNNKKEFEQYVKTDQVNISNYEVSYDKLVQTFCNREQRGKLRKLLNFKFKRHKNYNLSKERLEALEEMIQERARHFLQMDRVHLRNLVLKLD